MRLVLLLGLLLAGCTFVYFQGSDNRLDGVGYRGGALDIERHEPPATPRRKNDGHR